LRLSEVPLPCPSHKSLSRLVEPSTSDLFFLRGVSLTVVLGGARLTGGVAGQLRLVRSTGRPTIIIHHQSSHRLATVFFAVPRTPPLPCLSRLYPWRNCLTTIPICPCVSFHGLFSQPSLVGNRISLGGLGHWLGSCRSIRVGAVFTPRFAFLSLC
jgi:hypothetical protein